MGKTRDDEPSEFVQKEGSKWFKLNIQNIFHEKMR